jgi:hypothetical protein
LTHQISGGDSTPPTLSYFVKRTATRRLLIPEVRDGKNGYRCKLITNTRAIPGLDTIVPDETAFEEVLVNLRLMEPSNPSRGLASFWPSQFEDLRRVVGQFQGSRTSESWLPILS